MSRDWGMTNTGGVSDLTLTDGDLVLADETDVIVSSAKTRLLTILREWYYDRTKGIDWFDSMFTAATSYDQKVTILKASILEDPEITSITSFSFAIDPATREGEVEFTAQTIYSPIQVRIAV